MPYHLGTSKINFEKNSFSLKNSFYENSVSDGLWANVIVIFEITIVDDLIPCISLKKRRIRNRLKTVKRCISDSFILSSSENK